VKGPREGGAGAAIRKPGDLNARNGDPSARNGTEAPGGRLSAARSGKADRLEGKIVRQNLMWASATLALVIAACGGSSPASPTSSCANAGAANHAYVVVEHLSGTSIQKCVGFAGDTIDGQTLMDQSGVQYTAQTFSYGKAVCQVDNEPAQYSTCFPANQPYWALFVETGGAWASAATGYTAVTLHDKEALGWHYVQQSDPSPAPPPLAKP
jgi:hypothetical protein